MINHKPKETAPSVWVEVLIFLSSYYPLFLILLIRDISEKTNGIKFGFDSWGLKVSLWALAIFFLSSVASLIVGPLMRRLLIHQQGGTPIKIQEVSQVRGDMLNYTLPFLIGLFAFDYKSIQSILSLLIFLVFIFAFVHKEKISLLNPMFLLMGIRLYNIKYKEVGRSPIHNENALCLGKVEVSNQTVEIKETTGIHFIFPCKEISE
jgi:TctA family transporter